MKLQVMKHISLAYPAYMINVDVTSEDLDAMELLLNEFSGKSLLIPGTHFFSICKARFMNFCPTKAYMTGFRQQ